MKTKKGFTLAEVLVTLSVIGVVAALTIPSIISSSSEKQATTSIKKAASVLNQALTLSIAQDGLDASSQDDGAGLLSLFDNYLTALNVDTTNNAITTSDGMVYTFWGGGNCETNLDASANCMVEVDINGNRGTETAGSTTSYQDLYYFVILKEQVVPANEDVVWTGFGRSSSDVTSPPDNVAVEALTD